LIGRHEGEAALGLFAEQSEIGRGVADAEHALAGGVGPAAADTAADKAARHHAELPAVEIAQVDDIDRLTLNYHETGTTRAGARCRMPPVPARDRVRPNAK